MTSRWACQPPATQRRRRPRPHPHAVGRALEPDLPPRRAHRPEARLREGLLHQARGGHDHRTSTTLPAGCTIKPPDARSRQCPWVTALLKEQLSSSNPSGSWPKLTPTGQHAWRDTNRSSGACSNACGRTGSNRSATRSPSLLIHRSMEHVRAVRRNPYPQVSVLQDVRYRRPSPAPSGQSVRSCERHRPPRRPSPGRGRQLRVGAPMVFKIPVGSSPSAVLTCAVSGLLAKRSHGHPAYIPRAGSKSRAAQGHAVRGPRIMTPMRCCPD